MGLDQAIQKKSKGPKVEDDMDDDLTEAFELLFGERQSEVADKVEDEDDLAEAFELLFGEKQVELAGKVEDDEDLSEAFELLFGERPEEVSKKKEEEEDDEDLSEAFNYLFGNELELENAKEHRELELSEDEEEDYEEMTLEMSELLNLDEQTMNVLGNDDVMTEVLDTAVENPYLLRQTHRKDLRRYQRMIDHLKGLLKDLGITPAPNEAETTPEERDIETATDNEKGKTPAEKKPTALSLYTRMQSKTDDIQHEYTDWKDKAFSKDPNLRGKLRSFKNNYLFDGSKKHYVDESLRGLEGTDDAEAHKKMEEEFSMDLFIQQKLSGGAKAGGGKKSLGEAEDYTSPEGSIKWIYGYWQIVRFHLPGNPWSDALDKQKREASIIKYSARCLQGFVMLDNATKNIPQAEKEQTVKKHSTLAIMLTELNTYDLSMG